MQNEIQIELNRRDRKRYLEELSELESNLASYYKVQNCFPLFVPSWIT